MIGQTLSHYRILRQIGSGGMGVVYLATDERLDRQVALKVLPAGALGDESTRRSFRKEAILVSKLNHPNIATIHDFDSQAGTDFLVMEYISGVMLERKLAAGPLPHKEIVAIAPQIAQGLAAAHEQGVIHCDIKSGNIGITPDGRVKILDFGLARRLNRAPAMHLTDTLTGAPTTAGTLPYMAPEQLRGDPVDARCDIYAFGVVLYEMATGQRPFTDTWGPRLIDAILNQEPEAPNALNRKIPASLENIILKAMDKDPNRRYQSSKEMLVDLVRLSGPVTPVMAVSRRSPRRRWVLSAAAGAAALVVLLGLLDVGGWRGRLMGSAGGERIEAIAVLPLENLLGDPAQDYIADGLTEALIADLSTIKNLRVSSRTSVQQYKGAGKPLPEIARSLRVDAIIEGSVLQRENRVRITARLTNVATDSALWSQRFDRDLGDVLALQSDVSRAIAREIEAKVNPRVGGRGRAPSASSPEAHAAYLEGLTHWEKPTAEGFRKSVEQMEKAIRIDPQYAPAHAGLAESYVSLVAFGGIAEKEAYPKARAAAQRALEIDASLPEGHAVSGRLRFLFDWDWPGAEREFKRALELDPDSVMTHLSYASYLAAMGRIEEAKTHIGKAEEIDPLSLLTNVAAGRFNIAAGQHGLAIAQLRRALDSDPEYALTHDALGWAYLSQGMAAEAIEEFKAAIELPGNSWTMVTGLGYAYAMAGQKAQAMQILAQLEDLSRRRHVSAVGLATLHAGLGEREPALEWLQKAYADRETALALLRLSPAFTGLRGDTRFQDLLRRVGLPV